MKEFLWTEFSLGKMDQQGKPEKKYILNDKRYNDSGVLDVAKATEVPGHIKTFLCIEVGNGEGT